MTGTRTGDELREIRRRKMAESIELVALRLFAQHGVDAVSVDNIADAADISRRTFFRYFASKDDVLLGETQQQLDLARSAFAEADPATPPMVLLRRILHSLILLTEQRRELVVLRIRVAARDPEAFSKGALRSPVADVVIEGLAAHMQVDPRADLRPRVYVQAGFAATHAALQVWLAGGAKRSLEELTVEALDLILPSR